MKQPIANQVKKGLALAFGKFNEYSLSKYNQDGPIKLRDVLFLCRPKPKDIEQDHLWKKLAGGFCENCWKPLTLSKKAKEKGIEACSCENKKEAKLKIPDTWEVAISAVGKIKDPQKKHDEWVRLVTEGKLGALALLRNLRNLEESKVDRELVRLALDKADVSRVFPFRFIAAARFAPHFKPELQKAMFRCIEQMEKLKGKTVILVDVSGSMNHKLSTKSDMTRIDATCGIAMIAREICEETTIVSFSERHEEIPSKRGFTLYDAITNSQPHSGTYLGKAVTAYNDDKKYDRMIVISDEQSNDPVPKPVCELAYMINVASDENGVGYGPWTHITGFSEAVIKFIQEFEREELNG